MKEFLSRPPVEWLVNGVMRRAELVMAYGASGAGKTFALLDLALSLCVHGMYHGRQARRGPVVYVAAEATGSVRARVRAWQQAHGVSDEDLEASGLLFIEGPLQLGSEVGPDVVEDLIEELDELGISPVLIVIDTLARCAVGVDENSAKETGLVVADLDRLRTATGATVALVHHTGKNEEVERGSSALRAACDTVLRISKRGDVIHLICDKQKDGVDGPLFQFELQTMELGNDEDGHPITSAFITLLSLASEGKMPCNSRALPDAKDRIQNALRTAPSAEGLSRSSLQSAAELGQGTFDRSLKALLSAGLIKRTGVGRNTRYHGTLPAIEYQSRVPPNTGTQLGTRGSKSITTTTELSVPGGGDDDPRPRVGTVEPKK